MAVPRAAGRPRALGGADARRPRLRRRFVRHAAQVSGFVVNPAVAGMKYVDGLLVPVSTPEPDWDAYPA